MNKILLFLSCMLFSGSVALGQTMTATYTVSNTSTVAASGTLPSGSSATYSQTYSTTSQLTGGNNATLTLSGYAGKKISQIILSMRSNTSSGAGNLDMGAGTGTYPTGYATIYSIGTANFNNALWNGAYSTSYTNLTKTLATAYTVQASEKVVIRINATSNSLYIASFSIVYENPITDYYWDTSATSGLGGSATWGNTFSTVAAGNITLVGAPTTAAAIFQGTAGIVTLGSSQTVASCTFNVDGYTIATSGAIARTLAGTIDLTTKNITLSPIAAAGLTISGVISGTGSASSTILIKNGVGTLTLSSAGNTFTGKVLINDGYVAATGESRFGANPGALTADQITLNGGGISAVSGDISFTSNRGIRLNSSGGKFNPSSGRTITLTNVVSGTGDLNKEGAGTIILSGAHTYTGNTNVMAGTLQLASAERIANTSNLILSGGTFRTGSSTGYSETAGTLELKASSTIMLGTGSHNLVFANSSGINWDGTALTINGWTGTEGVSGTAGKIFVGSDASGLTAAQLAKITFSGTANGTMILPTGEIVPGLNTAPYFEIESISGTAFGSVCVNSTATIDGVFDLYGFNLTGDATVGPLDGFTFSIDGSTFTNSLTLPPSSGDVIETIRIRFTPTAAQSYSGSVLVGGGGVAVASTVAVTGTGNANNIPTVTIAITAGTNPECSGSTVIFTATPANTGGATVAYQWKLNGNNVGGNSATYTNTGLANDDAVDCTITLTGGSCLTTTTDVSDTITMVVHPIPSIPDALQITGDRTGCGSAVLAKSDSDWYWQTSNTGTATAPLNSAATYTASASGSIYVRAKNEFDCWSDALAIPIVVTIPVDIAANLPTTPRSTCDDGTGFATLSVSATGTGLSYQWYSNTSASTDVATSTGVGTNNNSFTPPSNALGTLFYYVVVSGTAPCAAVTSNILEHTVNPVAVITSLAPASGAPAGTVVTITGTGFTPGSNVKFGTVDATGVQVISSTEIQAVVPDGAVSNAVEVTTSLSCPAASTFTIINQDASGCN